MTDLPPPPAEPPHVPDANVPPVPPPQPAAPGAPVSGAGSDGRGLADAPDVAASAGAPVSGAGSDGRGLADAPDVAASAGAPVSGAGSDGRGLADAVRTEVGKAVVGQAEVVSGFLAALLADGHILLEGVPGVAKTLLVKAMASALHVDTTRIQFTPDLMPSDVTGQLMYEQHTSTFVFRKGPVFTNLLLADEINRTPPKTQAALLEVMEERQVSIGGEIRPLPDPFMVIATQNPVEYEGTYPLPEAQLDRFLVKIRVGYPDRDAEQEVLARHHRGAGLHEVASTQLQAVADGAALERARADVRRVGMDDSILGYITELVRSTRSSGVVDLGVSPRGGVALLGLSKAWAYMSGRDFVVPDDVKAVALMGLRHRLQVQPEAELEGVTPDIVLAGLLDSVPVPR